MIELVTPEEKARAWKTREWKERRRELILKYPRCEYCNHYSQAVNHRREGCEKGYENYLACNRDEVDIICNGCHLRFKNSRGQRRKRLYNDCAQCGCATPIPRVKCVSCEGSNESPTILDRCPDVRIGDVWENVWNWTGDVKVLGFEKQSLPWPLVKTDRAKEGVGLPAFIQKKDQWARLKKTGRGKTWKAWLEK